MNLLKRLSTALTEPTITRPKTALPAVRESGQRMAERHADTFKRLEDEQPQVEIPVLFEARGVERCTRCGQRAQKEQFFYAYRGMYFGADCVGRVLILERQYPGLSTPLLEEELVRDMQRFRAFGMARSARRIMRELDSAE